MSSSTPTLDRRPPDEPTPRPTGNADTALHPDNRSAPLHQRSSESPGEVEPTEPSAADPQQATDSDELAASTVHTGASVVSYEPPLTPASTASPVIAPNAPGRAFATSSPAAPENLEYHVSPNLYWWMKPAYTCVGIGVVIALVSWTLLTAPETLPIAFLPTYDVSHLTSVLVLFACLFGGVCFGSLRNPFARPHVVFTTADLARVRGLAAGMTFIVGTAYLIWLGFALSRGVSPLLILEVFTLSPGAIQAFKAMATPVGGLTTLVQLAPPAACLWVLLLKCGQRDALRPFLLLMTCTGLRAFMYAERLAVLEVVVPVVFCALGFVVTVREVTTKTDAGNEADARGKLGTSDGTGPELQGHPTPAAPAPPRRRSLFNLLPVLGAAAGWLLFTASEYTRSWQFYKYFYEDGFIAFVNARLITYYATAFNNGAVYAAAVDGRPHVAYMSCPALWDAPFIGSLLGQTGNDGYDWSDWWEGILTLYASAEFNSTGSFLVLNADLGVVLAAAVFLGVGLLIGWMHSLASQGSVAGLMALGSLSIGLYEALRFFYWGQGRFTPILFGFILAFVTLSTLPSRNRGHRPVAGIGEQLDDEPGLGNQPGGGVAPNRQGGRGAAAPTVDATVPATDHHLTAPGPLSVHQPAVTVT